MGVTEKAGPEQTGGRTQVKEGTWESSGGAAVGPGALARMCRIHGRLRALGSPLPVSWGRMALQEALGVVSGLQSLAVQDSGPLAQRGARGNPERGALKLASRALART